MTTASSSSWVGSAGSRERYKPAHGSCRYPLMRTSSAASFGNVSRSTELNRSCSRYGDAALRKWNRNLTKLLLREVQHHLVRQLIAQQAAIHRRARLRQHTANVVMPVQHIQRHSQIEPPIAPRQPMNLDTSRTQFRFTLLISNLIAEDEQILLPLCTPPTSPASTPAEFATPGPSPRAAADAFAAVPCGP